MPNYYAHLSLGAQVLSQLPQELSLLLNRERSAFDLGCLGPDPLFFYRPTLPNQMCIRDRSSTVQTTPVLLY